MEPTNVLLVDDDEQFRKVLELQVRSFFPGVTSVGCRTVADALGALSPRHQFDLVILDHHLPDGTAQDILISGQVDNIATLIMSADESPILPGQSLVSGADFFLTKRDLTQPLLKPLITGMIERAALSRAVDEAKLHSAITANIRTLLTTLKHEINNPLGVVLGAIHLFSDSDSPKVREAAEAISQSAHRIKDVMQHLHDEVEQGTLQKVTKSGREVFSTGKDEQWEE